MVKKVLTAQAIAAMAAGGFVASAGAPEAPAAPAVTDPATTEAAAEPAEAASAAPAEAAAAAPAALSVVTPPADVVAFLQGQVATKDAALLAANVENANLKAKVTDFEASLGGLVAIAAKSINNMRVALGGSATDLTALTPTQLLAQHEAATKEFETKFVAGGVAAVDAAQASNEKNAGAVDALQEARLNAVLGK